MSNKFADFHQKFVSDAKEWVENKSLEPDFEDLVKRLRENHNFDSLYASAGENEFKTAYNQALKAVIDSVYQPNLEVLETSVVAYNRMLAMMGLDSLPRKNGWLSSGLMQSHIAEMKDDSRYNTVSEYDYSNVEGYFARRFFKFSLEHNTITSFGRESIRLLDLKEDTVVEANEIFNVIHEYGDQDELIGYLLGLANSMDGGIKNDRRSGRGQEPLTRPYVNALIASKALAFLTGEAQSSAEIYLASQQGMVPNIALWDTKGFQKSMAPKVTSESIEKTKPLLDRWLKDDLREELRADLSDRDLFNSFFSGSVNDLLYWQQAMDAYAIITGNELTFNEARELNPSSYFQLKSTTAYMKKLDRDFESSGIAEKYSQLNCEWNLDKDGDCEYIFCVESEAMRLDVVSDKMTDLIYDLKDCDLTVSEGCDAVYAEITFDESLSKKDRKGKLAELEKTLQTEFAKIVAEEMLPGDLVEVCQSEYEEPEEDIGVKFGSKGVVVSRTDDQLKIKGVGQFLSVENAFLSKKRELSNDQSESLNM